MAIGTVINGLRVQNISPRIVTLTSETRGLNIRIPEMVRVCGGKFFMGSDTISNAGPVRQVALSDFSIGKYPVTNEEYRGYLKATGQEIPSIYGYEDDDTHPAIGVSYNDAGSYCKFLMELTGRKFGLPTEAQWEFAARGPEGRPYPWGPETPQGRVNFNSTMTTPVDSFPSGATPSGIFDMSGNVWEWCVDWYGNYKGDDLTDPKGPKRGSYRVVRGSSWNNNHEDRLLSVSRAKCAPTSSSFRIGFRIAEDI